MINGRSMKTINGRAARTAFHKEQVGRNLTIAREGLGATRNDWIKTYGASHGIYSSKLCMWEGGVSYPDLFFLIALCENHGLTLDFFLRGELRGLSSELASALASAAGGISVLVEAKVSP